MFVYSVRASTVKFFGFVVLTLALIIGTAVFSEDSSVFASSSIGEINYAGIRDDADRVAFIERLGLRVDADMREEKAFKIPRNFDRVILGYNELQKKQGLDLSGYSYKRVTRYTYTVTNYDYDGVVYANLFVYRDKIVACDLSSADPEGFVIPLTLVEKEKIK